MAIETWLERSAVIQAGSRRPVITLSFAQSLDGSITARRGEPTALSGPESTHLTHRLRLAHDAILVGVGTVLADDPLLTARIPARSTHNL